MFEKLNLAGGVRTESAEIPQPPSGVAADHLRVAAREEVAKDLAERPRRKYTRRNTSDVGDDQRALQSKVDSAIIAQLDALHDPKLWSALLCFPADGARLLTGHERWKLADEERATLGAAGSAAARTMMITNPRALALSMCATALAMAYLPRALAQMKDFADKKNAEKKPDVAA